MPGLRGSDFRDNHFGFTEKSSGSDLRSYTSHLFRSKDSEEVSGRQVKRILQKRGLSEVLDKESGVCQYGDTN